MYTISSQTYILTFKLIQLLDDTETIPALNSSPTIRGTLNLRISRSVYAVLSNTTYYSFINITVQALYDQLFLLTSIW